MSEIGKGPKTELLTVRISACSGLKNSHKSVRNWNGRQSMFWAQTEEFWAHSYKNQTFYVQDLNYVRNPIILVPLGLMNVLILDIQNRPETELLCLDFGHMPKTKPSENGTEVNRLRTELVRISDVDCTTTFYCFD